MIFDYISAQTLYWVLGAVGANLIGLGVTLLWHANNLMLGQRTFKEWFSIGTLGLIFHIMGIAFMIECAKNLFWTLG